MVAEEEKQSEQGTLRVVQITDSHLFGQPGARLVGLDSQESFEEVLALIRRQQSAIDCILCTGDIAQDASRQAYQRFFAALDAFHVPYYCIPGNHDDLESLRAALHGDERRLSKGVALGGWQIVMLDSSVTGKVHGFLSEAELEFLDAQLEAGSAMGRHALVCVHHNPLPVRASWLQKHALRNDDQFFAVLDRYPHVRGVLWGHIHQEFEGERKGVRMLASPSTCIQFHPDNDEFTLDRKSPGYRWLDLHPDGRIDSGVERVAMAFDIDFSSLGY